MPAGRMQLDIAPENLMPCYILSEPFLMKALFEHIGWSLSAYSNPFLAWWMEPGPEL